MPPVPFPLSKSLLRREEDEEVEELEVAPSTTTGAAKHQPFPLSRGLLHAQEKQAAAPSQVSPVEAASVSPRAVPARQQPSVLPVAPHAYSSPPSPRVAPRHSAPSPPPSSSRYSQPVADYEEAEAEEEEVEAEAAAEAEAEAGGYPSEYTEEPYADQRYTEEAYAKQPEYEAEVTEVALEEAEPAVETVPVYAPTPVYVPQPPPRAAARPTAPAPTQSSYALGAVAAGASVRGRSDMPVYNVSKNGINPKRMFGVRLCGKGFDVRVASAFTGVY